MCDVAKEDTLGKSKKESMEFHDMQGFSLRRQAVCQISGDDSLWDFQVYVENILALQSKAEARGKHVLLPLAIMTSDDTHARTLALLEANSYFRAQPSQIHLIKQEKVRSWPLRTP